MPPMLNFLKCGCIFEIERDNYPLIYYRDSLNRFEVCKDCTVDEKKITEEDIRAKVDKIIDTLWKNVISNKMKRDEWVNAQDYFKWVK